MARCASRPSFQPEGLALAVRRSGTDRKWRELANLLSEIFTPAAIASGLSEESMTADAGAANRPKASASQKLVIFTEHRDTLIYLEQRISTLLGRLRCLFVPIDLRAREGYNSA
jgi:hypothetical protein